MPMHQVVILGAGAAGTAAAAAFSKAPGVHATLMSASEEGSYNRTLVNKGVAAGLIEPGQAVLPDPGVPIVDGTARSVDAAAGSVLLTSGASVDFDALVVATGSGPRRLDADLPGVGDVVGMGRLSTLHSMRDAVRVRDVLARSPHPARVVVLGAGVLAAETSALLRRAGQEVAMVARSSTPGCSAFGEVVADRVAALHRTHVSTYFGRSVRALTVEGSAVTLVLDDRTRLGADLIVAAHGTVAVPPAPWTDGIEVDGYLRAIDTPHVYAAGGVAVHHHEALGWWRIDPWADAAAQGTHVARSVLHDRGLGPDPGPYLARSTFSTRLYDQTLSGAGITGIFDSARVVSTDPLVVVHEQDDTAVAVVGLDAGRLVQDWAPRLHADSSAKRIRA
ncbi:FAD-dependent oxidoreductase [Aeromicrobium sp. CTD01-1L150]|uniref:FAD-dependent oxidoreductase n=1 Tax=Aeromicrobium sp. CTD01-1L150 TaxID=3341830 RepID=UPI0035C0A4DF